MLKYQPAISAGLIRESPEASHDRLNVSVKKIQSGRRVGVQPGR